MNQKAAVTKDINARHLKILEGLLKLPENRECADCKSRAPRWASVNFGIFICMQCSGIHRSLGVHISKVRSATLDTWLPEQVELIQSMGNEKSNAYWEAELPPNYDRMKIENFIRAKYVEKRWISKDGKHNMDLPTKEALSTRLRPRSSDGHRDASNHGHLYRERKSVDQSACLTKSGPVLRLHLNNQKPEDVAGNHRMSTSSSCSTSNSFSSEPHTASMQGNLDLEHEKVNSVPDAPETKPTVTGSRYPSQVNKSDYATQLFNIFSVGDSLQTTVTNTWVAFESDEGSPPPRLEEKPESKKQSDTKIDPEPERKNSIEESKSLVPFSGKEIQEAAVKNETEKPSPESISVGVESIHHQRLAMLAPEDFLPVEENPCAVSKTHMIDQSSSSSHVIHEPKQSNGHVIHPQQSSRPLIHGQANGLLVHQQQPIKQMAQSNGQLVQQPHQSSNCAESHPRQSWSKQNYSMGNKMPLAQVHTMGINKSTLNQNAWSANSSSKNYSAVPLTAISSNGHVNLAGRAVNGAAVVGTRSSPPVSSMPVSGYDYDFSSLTQGFFKRQ